MGRSRDRWVDGFVCEREANASGVGRTTLLKLARAGKGASSTTSQHKEELIDLTWSELAELLHLLSSFPTLCVFSMGPR